MEHNGSFDFLKRITYERTGGSEAELKTANMIITECHKYHVEAHLEEFLVDGYEIKNVSLETIDGTFNATGVGMSGSTGIDGLVGELVIIESDEQLSAMDSLEGKIVFIPTRMMVKTYKLLCEKKVSGFICCSGSVYDDIDQTDLEKMTLRERHYQNGKIPGVCIRMVDAQKLLVSRPKEVKMNLQQDEFKLTSHNVVATIPGTTKKHEIVCFTAHYDSVPFSTGAYDNGTGSATILEALAYFSKVRPTRTLKFIWCGSEEMGLLGSKAYTEAHKEELSAYKLCINIDMTGVVIGKDFYMEMKKSFTFKLPISILQVSKFFLNQKYLAELNQLTSLDSIQFPVQIIEDEYVLLDNHHFLFIAKELGFKMVDVYLSEVKQNTLDFLYLAKEQNIKGIQDVRSLSDEEYHKI